MQINSANSYTPQASGSLAVDNQNQVAQQRDRFRVQQETQQAQQTKDQEQKSSQVNRFDVDEKSLALVEESQQRAAESERPSSQLSSQTNDKPEQLNKSNKQTAYDNPSQQNKSAIAAYSSVGNIAQRENIQQVFGVDLLV
jgi:hypothetical protein